MRAHTCIHTFSYVCGPPGSNLKLSLYVCACVCVCRCQHELSLVEPQLRHAQHKLEESERRNQDLHQLLTFTSDMVSRALQAPPGSASGTALLAYVLNTLASAGYAKADAAGPDAGGDVDVAPATAIVAGSAQQEVLALDASSSSCSHPTRSWPVNSNCPTTPTTRSSSTSLSSEMDGVGVSGQQPCISNVAVQQSICGAGQQEDGLAAGGRAAVQKYAVGSAGQYQSIGVQEFVGVPGWQDGWDEGGMPAARDVGSGGGAGGGAGGEGGMSPHAPAHFQAVALSSAVPAAAVYDLGGHRGHRTRADRLSHRATGGSRVCWGLPSTGGSRACWGLPATGGSRACWGLPATGGSRVC